MPTNLRTLGVEAKNLPAIKSLTVRGSDFSIAGMLIETERKFNKAFKISRIENYEEIFGVRVNPNFYGGDVVKGFFDNLLGVDGSLYVQSLIGYDTSGDAIDAVVASREVEDEGADADAYLIQPAYEEELQYGIGGNRIGTKITQANRFETQASATALATAYTIYLDSVIGIRVGDIIGIDLTGGGTETVYHKITAIDESAKSVTWTDAVLGTYTLAVDDDVYVLGFKIQTYYKSINGIETEVDKDLGKIICSSESEVTDFYVENIFASSKWIKVTEQLAASTLADRLPTEDATVQYCTSGADGTTVATVEAQDYFLANFDNLPVRWIANPETTDEAMQKALITYSLARDNDNPIVAVNIAEDRTKSQLITIGDSYQISSFNPAFIPANWLEVSDPFSNSAIAPNRHVPCVGHVIGAWIWTLTTLGVHFAPCTTATIIRGALDVVGEQLLDNTDRTDVAEHGVNIIQNISGVGIILKNIFTCSTDEAYLFGNGILMRNYIKVSGEDSLQRTENTPNSIKRIRASKMAMLKYLYQLWDKGSTGTVVTGETFGQSEDEDGNLTTREDHISVTADLTNNPQDKINLGERNIWAYFTYPAPAGSIRIGVGIKLR